MIIFCHIIYAIHNPPQFTAGNKNFPNLRNKERLALKTYFLQRCSISVQKFFDNQIYPQIYFIYYKISSITQKKKKNPSKIPPVLRPNLSEHEPLNCFQNLLRLILLSGLRYSTKVNNILSEFVCLSKLEFYLFKS